MRSGADGCGAARDTAQHLPGAGAACSRGRGRITHGNGPQVGNELLRANEPPTRSAASPLPCRRTDSGGDRSAHRGGALRSHVATGRGSHPCPRRPGRSRVPRPDEPIGPFYSEDEARALGRDRGWEPVEDSGRGSRRVSPRRARSTSSSSSRSGRSSNRRHRRRVRRRGDPRRQQKRPPEGRGRRDRQGPRVRCSRPGSAPTGS